MSPARRRTFSDRELCSPKYSERRLALTAISGLLISTEVGPTVGGRPRMAVISS